MLDKGYCIEAIEMLNWGNFHGLQKVFLRNAGTDGILFAPPPASAIIGINGSGKSTLIDGLMMALLPFENSLKLGVTNDIENGSSGGRTIRDYVLGKYSASGEEVSKSLENIYGRKDGCSIFLIRFKHNQYNDRTFSFGRIWWYQNFRVNESQAAFIHYDSLTIEQICENKQPPKNIRSFRELTKKQLPEIQIFDTMNNYFMALSSSLGNISKDDLKILNRAFYVKSISQIDQFIRENMLIEQENPHLDRLLENVRNGQEIALSIQTCNKKISIIEKILLHLRRVQEVSEKKQEVEFERQLLSLYKDWIDIENTKTQIESERKEMEHFEVQLPSLESESLELTALKDRLFQQLYQKDVDARLQQVDSEVRHLVEKTQWIEGQKLQLENRLKKLHLKIPADKDSWNSLQSKIKTEIAKSDDETLNCNAELEKLREKKIFIDAESQELRSELEHLSKFNTLIPRDLYAIKESAKQELKIPDSHLYFVGELIQIKEKFLSNRRAIESVLFPISRNLLCHPDSLNSLTKWLDSKGLKSDITVKRIKSEELEILDVARTVGDSKNSEIKYAHDLVLEMIDVLPETDHPFFHYLWKWLRDVFDYRLVPVQKFRSEDTKLVTPDGLVKTDNRTFRKLKTHFSFSLGWDNKDAIQIIAGNLTQLNTELQKIRSSLDLGIEKLQQIEETRRNLIFVRDEQTSEFLTLNQLQLQIRNLQIEKSQLLKTNPDYLKLKKEAEEANQSLEILINRISECRVKIQNKKQFIDKISNIKEFREKELTSSLLYGESTSRLGSEENLILALQALHKKITLDQSTRIAFESQLQKQAELLDGQKQKHISAASQELSQYRREYSDPNLIYLISENQDLRELITSWVGVDEKLRLTELPAAQEKWKSFFDQILVESVKDTINEIKSKSHDITVSIQSINDVLKLTNFEDLPTEKRYLRIDIQVSADDRVRKFKRHMSEAEKTLGPAFRSQVEAHSDDIMQALTNFVEDLQKDTSYRLFVTDVRNHFHFKVQSLRRVDNGEDQLMETFTGSRKDAKSSAQTTQLAYALLASCLSYRFRFHDPVRGKDTPRLLILDEFGGKFDNEKPREVLKLLNQMGFQSILVSPMSKADLLAENVNYLVLVHKVSASHSKTQSYPVTSKYEYDRLIGKRRDEMRI